MGDGPEKNIRAPLPKPRVAGCAPVLAFLSVHRHVQPVLVGREGHGRKVRTVAFQGVEVIEVETQVTIASASCVYYGGAAGQSGRRIARTSAGDFWLCAAWKQAHRFLADFTRHQRGVPIGTPSLKQAADPAASSRHTIRHTHVTPGHSRPRKGDIARLSQGHYGGSRRPPGLQCLSSAHPVHSSDP
jgi:hypothetical protein